MSNSFHQHHFSAVNTDVHYIGLSSFPVLVVLFLFQTFPLVLQMSSKKYDQILIAVLIFLFFTFLKIFQHAAQLCLGTWNLVLP